MGRLARRARPARAPWPFALPAAGCALVALLAAVPHARAAAVDTGVCLDDEIKADLDAKRRTRGTRERLVQKTNRHELSVRGGHYVSDLFESTYAVGGAYAFHLTEDFAVEASGLYTRVTSRAATELERVFEVLGDRSRAAAVFMTNLTYSPIYAKAQFGARIARFDVLFTAGLGVVDSALSSGVAGNAGVGFLFFMGKALALRIDVRNYIYRQQLLADKVLVNDLAITLGLSMFLPFSE